MFETDLSWDALRVLRDCELLSGGIDTNGVGFVRCGRNLGVDGAKIAKEIREKLGDKPSDVFCAWHETREDYVRVNCETAAFRMICALKS